MYKVLVVDDDDSLHENLQAVLPEEYQLTKCVCVRQALSFLSSQNYDAILLDLALPDGSGFEVLDASVRMKSTAPVVVLTGYSDVPTIVDAVRRGASDYVTKPYTSDYLLKAVRDAASRYATRRAMEEGEFGELIGFCEPMLEVKRLIALYAKTDRTVLINGESGTGKEAVAHALHRLSPRRSGHFIPRNAAAIPLELFESELFGSERGAYTGAVSRQGCFEEAAGGTLFLDEIGDLEPSAQARLLRVLETKTVRRLGGVHDVDVDVRLVFATNRDLPAMVRAGRFRQDLYHRINVFSLTMPPLRVRGDDLLVLTEYFLNGCGKTKFDIDDGALEVLLAHDWPGNVRELKSAIERAAILSGPGKIRAEHVVGCKDLGFSRSV